MIGTNRSSDLGENIRECLALLNTALVPFKWYLRWKTSFRYDANPYLQIRWVIFLTKLVGTFLIPLQETYVVETN